MKTKKLVLSATLVMMMVPAVSIAAAAAEKLKPDARQQPPRVEDRRDSRDNRGVNDAANERRLQQLERVVSLLEDRVEDLERGDLGGGGRVSGYYCIAQCRGDTRTQHGGSGRTESEAKLAAVTEVRKYWNCGAGIENVECSADRGGR